MRTSLAPALALVLLAACTTPPAPASQASGTAPPAEQTQTSVRPSSPHPPNRPARAPRRRAIPQLQGRLTALLADPSLEVAAPLGVVVLDPRGYEVVGSGHRQPLIPASTMKLVTAAAALHALGPEHRFVTQLRATAPIGDDGTIEGDLVIVGSGDPTLATPAYAENAYPDRPRARLEDLADTVVERGLRRVTGDVVGDPTVFADEPVPAGWLEQYLLDLDAAYVSGLTVDAGRDVTYREDGRAIGVASADPAATTATRFAELLAERGVVVDGDPRSARPAPSTEVHLGEVRSPPLARTLRYLINYSDNHLTDGIFRAVGAQGDLPGTWSSSAEAVRQALADLDLPWDGVVLTDGSGLSREDRLTASFLAGLDRAMYLSSHTDVWSELMAVAGRSGTMRSRLRGTLAAGLLRGKTGTLDDVRAFVGAVETTRGRFHLAVIGNELRGVSRDRVRLLQDEIALLLTEDLLGCDRTPIVSEVVASPDVAPPSTARLEGNLVVCPG